MWTVKITYFTAVALAGSLEAGSASELTFMTEQLELVTYITFQKITFE